MKIFSKKYLIVCTAIVSGAVSLFTFNNMVSVPNDLALLKEESRVLAVKLRAPRVTPLVRMMITKHKALVSDYIAKKVLATSCAHLLAADPNMTSGDYVLFPQGDVLRRSAYRCIIQNGRLSRAEKIRDLQNLPPVQVATSSAATVSTTSSVTSCDSIGYQRKVCPIKDLSQLPALKQQVSSSKCILNETYFVDYSGITVDKGCRATFDVNTFRTIASAPPAAPAKPLNLYERRSGSDR